MSFIIRPWHIFLLGLSSLVNRQQQQTIDYLITENQIRKEKLGKKRILLNDDQQRRLDVKGKMLLEIATIVTPDTILRRHRQLVAEKWDFSDRRAKKPGQPPVSEEMKQLVLRTALENPSWRYDRIQGAPASENSVKIIPNLGENIF